MSTSSINAKHISLGLLGLGALFVAISALSSYQQIPKVADAGSDVGATDSKVQFKSAKTAAALDTVGLVLVIAGIAGVAMRCRV